MINCLKVTCLFIGAIVGAGFATGREIVVFFRGLSIFAPILAGLIIGVMCAIFLLFGKIDLSGRAGRIVNTILDYMMFISMVVTYMVMCSAAEELTAQCFGIAFVGLVSGVIFAVLSMFDIGFIKNISLIMVAIIIAFVIVLAHNTQLSVAGGVDVKTAIKYCAMNMLGGGYLISQEGKSMKGKHIAICATLCGLICAVLLGLVYLIATTNSNASMPVYAAANAKGYGIIGGLLILLAVMSTMLGAGRIIYVTTRRMCGNGYVPAVFLIGIAAISYTLDFESAVEIFYPPLGTLGEALCAVAIIILIATAVIKIKRRHTLKL
ncbi:MAG: hypothetical protein K2M44_05975 [Clostridia bacterium]|nr:hypothetical protein [Clostridia bacterium]